jgi:hypothetical protein
MLSSHMFMKKGGILGFHCTYQYPQTSEGTYYYERYPRTLKGTDAVLFTLFRAFGLTVHIKAYKGHCYGSADDATKRCRGLISTQDDIGGESEMNQMSNFESGRYVGEEIFRGVAWFNEWAPKEDGKEYHEVARPVTNWIGNETEIDWEYAFLVLLVVVPEFSKRELKD